MKSNKKLVTIAMIIVVVIALAAAAFYFFSRNSKVEGEATLVKMELPAATDNLKMSLDVIKVEKIKGKDVLTIKGWVFKQNGTEKKRDGFIVLKSPASTLIFDIEKDNVPRADVSKYFQMDATLQNLGVEMAIPLKDLEDNTYQVGFILADDAGKNFMMGTKSIALANGAVTITDLKQADNKPTTNKVTISIKPPTAKIKYGYDNINLSGNILTIAGWGFIQGTNTDNLKSYIVLTKNDTATIFSVEKRIRKDVSNTYKDTKLNYDSSGFFTTIKTEEMKPGHYRIGYYLVKGDQIGMVYPDKFVDIGK
ncbi:MAG: hypothetical protein ACOYNC_04240 [Bacteroidales bacterium]